MGIEGLKTLVDKCPNAQRFIPARFFRGKRIAIDAGNVMVKTITSIWSKEVERTRYPNEEPNMDRFIRQWLNRLYSDLNFFLQAGITPIYVFDGKNPPEKEKCQIKRRGERQKCQEEYDQLLDRISQMNESQYRTIIGQLKTKAKRLFPCSYEMIGLMQEFYGSLGVPVIECKEESERLCAQLVRSGYCSAVFTEDRDTLVHGAPIIIIDKGAMIEFEGRNEPAIEIIDLYELLIGLQLSFAQFVDLCIMCGCDYNDRIKQLGPGRAYPLIRKYGSIANIPNSDINRWFKIHIKRNPSDSHMLQDPKQVLQLEACYRRFAPISVDELISERDRELDILNDLTMAEQIGFEAVEFLSAYQMENLIAFINTMLALHPQIPPKDGLLTFTPDIVKLPKGKLIVGINLRQKWGI